MMLFLTDSQVETELGKRFKSYRLNRNLSQAELASRSNVSRRTINALEHGEGSSLATFIAVLRGLHAIDALDDFLPYPGLSPLAILREEPTKYPSKPRKARATTPWKWGDEK